MNFLMKKFYECKAVWSEYFERKRIRFVWGIKSGDDVSGRRADLYTLNDFEIDYLPKRKKYFYGVETQYMFKDENREVKYLKNILKVFTIWMRKNGLSTDYTPPIFELFYEHEYFDSLEELYGYFKLKCLGYARMIRIESKKKIIKEN